MEKRHKIFLGSFGTIVLVFMIVTAIVLNAIILKQTAENKALKEKIEELESRINIKINEIATNLIKTNTAIAKDLSLINKELTVTNKEIGKIKATDYKDFSGVIDASKDSILLIQTLEKQGTGFMIDNNGHLITNTHVLQDDDGELLTLIQVSTINGDIYIGTLLGVIEVLDLALLKIDGELPPLEFEKSENIRIGEHVIAIGSPQGLAFSATDGIVSATNRIGFNGIPAYIQTNAELNEGNSGGPLINKEGKVIGMNNFKVFEAEGLGFALESDMVIKGINQIAISVYNQTLID